jgi:ribosomal protein L33
MYPYNKCNPEVICKFACSSKPGGPKYQEGKTWHPELSDKAGSVKTHVYWSMKNCEQDPEKLKLNILNITQHYQNN